MTSLSQASGAPKPVRARGRTWLVSPLTLRDLETYALAFPSKRVERTGASLLLWLSLRRNHQDLDLRDAERLIRRKRDAAALVGAMLLLNDGLLVSKTEEADKPKDDKTKPEDGCDMYRLLAMLYKWDANRVGDLTMAQALMYLEGGDVAGVAKQYATFETLEEARAYIAARKAGGG